MGIIIIIIIAILWVNNWKFGWVRKLTKAYSFVSRRNNIKTPAVWLYNLFTSQWLYHSSPANIL